MTLNTDLVREAAELLARASVVAEASGAVLDTSPGHAPPGSRPPTNTGPATFDRIAKIIGPATTDEELRAAINHARRVLRRHTHSPNSARVDRIAWDTVEERRRIMVDLAVAGFSQRVIAIRLGVNHATISRDLARLRTEAA